MFAPKPFDVAKEMVRVTKPGGRIVMGNWIPSDPTLVAQILKISSAYSPPPPEGFVSPMTVGRRSTTSSSASRRRRSPEKNRVRARHVHLRLPTAAGAISSHAFREYLRPDDERVRRRVEMRLGRGSAPQLGFVRIQKNSSGNDHATAFPRPSCGYCRGLIASSTAGSHSSS